MVKGSKNKSIDSAIKTIDTFVPEDSMPEEFLEDLLENYTGIEMDFSPASPEK